MAEIFAVKTGSMDAFAKQAETTFARYQAAGAHQAGMLATLDAPNNFPQPPVRTDGPCLIYLGVIKNKRSAPELIVMDPAQRSRLRWLSECRQ